MRDVPAHAAPALTVEQWRSSGQPSLTADGLTLRPWTPADVDTLVAAYADPGIQRWHVQDMTAEEAAAWVLTRAERWDTGTGADWAVTSVSGENLGRIAFNRVDLWEGASEIAYWVLPAARGRRIAPRALGVLADWGFHEAGLHRLFLRHAVDNQPSCRVAAHAGFALEGTLRGSGRHADGWHDMHLHARLASDPPAG
ncbi:GNAT family N-acetyltransferase [Jatrophihabitans sp. YIM 134969]